MKRVHFVLLSLCFAVACGGTQTSTKTDDTIASASPTTSSIPASTPAPAADHNVLTSNNAAPAPAANQPPDVAALPPVVAPPKSQNQKSSAAVIPAPYDAMLDQMDVNAFEDETDGHRVIVAQVVNKDRSPAGEGFEMDDYNNDGRVDEIFYTNQIDMLHGRIWIAAWWRGPQASAWYRKNLIQLKSPENISDNQFGVNDIDLFFAKKASLNMESSDSTVIGSAFAGADELMAGWIQMVKMGKNAQTTPLFLQGMRDMLAVLSNRGEFQALGAKPKTLSQMSHINPMLMAPPKNLSSSKYSL